MIEQDCIKCGYDKARMKYHGHTSFVEESNTLTEKNIIPITQLCTKEIIEVTCICCEYTWFRKPLDVQKRGEIDV